MRTGLRVAALLAALALPPAGAGAQEAAGGDAARGETGGARPPSAQDLVLLRDIGFNEAQILAELEPFAGRVAYGADAVARLEEAGFSAGFLESLRALAPRRTLTNEDIARALDDGTPTRDILEEIAGAETAFDTAPRAMLALGEGREIPVAVTKAMLGAPLTAEDLARLAEDGAGEAVQLRLLGLLGAEVAVEDPAAALELSRAGVPPAVLKALREAGAPAAAAGGGAAPAGGEADAPDMAAETLERFTHVTDIVSFAYPRSWYFDRLVALEGPVYQATSHQPAEGERGRITAEGAGITVLYWPREAISRSETIEAAELLDDALARGFAQRLGTVEPRGEARATTLGGHDAAARDYTAVVEGEAVSLRWHLAITEDHFVGIMMHAPAAGFAAEAPRFDRLAGEIAFERSTRARSVTEGGHTSGALADRYREAVVAIIVSDDGEEWRSGGSGFFIRSDGYLLTNAHVVERPGDTDEPWRFFRVIWSSELDIEGQDAELVDRVHTEAAIRGGVSPGVDLALLKVSGIGDYETIPLSPLETTDIGDPLITMGFPQLQRFDGQASTTISSGVVTRFTRDPEDRIDGIVTDAQAGAGNSGGPAISLVTGGVVGIVTTRNIVGRTEGEAGARADLRTVEVTGIMPIDEALARYPQETIVRAARDRRLVATDAYDLALFAEQRGWREGAIRLAEKAVQRAPNAPETHHLLARVLLAPHADRTEEDIRRGERELELALSIDPDFQAALYTKADHEIDREEYLDAIKAINSAIDAQDTWTGRLKRARIFELMGQPGDAIEDLGRAVSLSQGAAVEPHLVLGRVLYAEERFEEGLETYREALAIAPHNIEARLGVGRYHLHTGSLLEALLAFDEVAGDEPRDPDARAAVAMAYARQGNDEKAVENHERAIDLYRQAERVAPEEVIAEAAEIAADRLLDAERGRRFYALYASLYWESRGTLRGHRYLADRAEDEPAIRRAHLTRAIELKGNRQDDEREALDAQLDEVRAARLDLDDLRTMGRRGYPAHLVAQLVLTAPGTYPLAGSTNRDGEHDAARREALRALGQEFGSHVTNAILARVRETETAARGGGNGEGGADGEDPRGVPVAGTWLWTGRDGQGREVQHEFVLGDDRRYTSTRIVAGQRQTAIRGAWALERGDRGDVLVLTPARGEAQRLALRGVRNDDGEQLVITQNDRAFTYRRVQGG